MVHLLYVHLTSFRVFLQLVLSLSPRGNDSTRAHSSGRLRAGFMSIFALKYSFNTALLEVLGGMSL